MRELELRQLARELLSSDLSHALGSLKEKIKSYTDGQLPHAEHILPALYELMESNESVTERPLSALEPSNEQGVTGGDWDGLKTALTGSLTSGTFLDSQFYAVELRSSTGLPKIRLVYFCSAVGGSFAFKLTACESLTPEPRLPTHRSGRFLETQGVESAAPCTCGRLRQRCWWRRIGHTGFPSALPVLDVVRRSAPDS